MRDEDQRLTGSFLLYKSNTKALLINLYTKRTDYTKFLLSDSQNVLKANLTFKLTLKIHFP